jgi:hypothetical protein
MTQKRDLAVRTPLTDYRPTKLLAGLHDSQSATVAEIAREFTLLQRVVSALPLTSAEYCFALNWITSARQLWEKGDCGAAHYQISLVIKKLNLGS